MRIAIIPASFNSKLTYNENICADAFHQMGHEVIVYCSKYCGLSENEMIELDRKNKYQIYRMSGVFKIRETQFVYDQSIKIELNRFNPELAILFAPLSGIGYSLLKSIPVGCRVVSGFSDIPLHRENRTPFWFVKKRWVKKIFDRSYRIYAATKQTLKLLEEWGDQNSRNKMILNGLAIDRSVFLTSHTVAADIAGFIDSVRSYSVIITRVIPGKNIDQLYGQIEKLLLNNPTHGFIIAGLLENEDSTKLRKIVEVSGCANRVLLLKQQSIDVVATLFRNARFSLWNGVSIGIYHSLCCSCPVVVWSKRGSAEHLVHEGVNGLWYEDVNMLADTMQAAMERDWDKTIVENSVAQADSVLYCTQILSDSGFIIKS